MTKVDKRFDASRDYGFGTDSMKQIKVCTSCGRAEDSDLYFCRECGTPLPKATLFEEYKENHRTCEKCGTILTDKMIYCPKCGHENKK